MKILIDGDSCSVISTTERLAKKYRIPCHIYCDTTRSIKSKYAQVHVVDCSKDAADFAIISACSENDIVITNDSGLAALVLAKNGIAINTRGTEYTDINILGYLNTRYVRQLTVRQTHKKTVKGKLYEDNDKQSCYRIVLTNLLKARCCNQLLDEMENLNG